MLHHRLQKSLSGNKNTKREENTITQYKSKLSLYQYHKAREENTITQYITKAIFVSPAPQGKTKGVACYWRGRASTQYM